MNQSGDKVFEEEKPDSEAKGENSTQIFKDTVTAETGAGNLKPDEETTIVKPPLWLRDSRRAPNPYEGNLTGKGEEQSDCEQRFREELEAAWHTSPRNLMEQNEVETADYEWRDCQIHWEKFLNIDLNDEEPFKDSKILSRLQERKGNVVPTESKAPIEARQMALAHHYQGMHVSVPPKAIYQSAKGKGNPRKLLEPKNHIRQSDQALYQGKDDDEIKDKWAGLADQYKSIMNSKKKPKVHRDDIVHSTEELLVKIVESWSGWGLRVTANSVDDNRGDKIAAEDSNLLRPTPKNSINILVDKNGRLLAILIPEAIQHAFSTEVRDRMLTDTKHFYTHIKYANPQNNKRHLSEQSHSERRYGPPGSDHYGVWHENGQEHEPIRETSDSSLCVSFVKQCLLHFLENTAGTMTKLLDFWFGVWEPNLREEYRRVYRNLPKYARLPPTNEDRDEIYTLRVAVVNRDTDHHRDQRDWKLGLTGLVQLGDFEGGGMCLEELGVRLEGYGDGAMLLFRGSGINHYVAPWNWAKGGYRYAFDHTTHESVRKVLVNKKPYPEYVQPEFPEDDPVYKPKPESKNKDHGKRDGSPGSRAKKSKGNEATAKKEATEREVSAKKAKGKGKATKDTHSEFGDNPTTDAVSNHDEAVEPPHKPSKPKKWAATQASDDDDGDSGSPIPMVKPPGTIRTARKRVPVTEYSDDEDNESSRPLTKRPRTNKKDNAPDKLSPEPVRVRRRKRAR